MADAVKIGRYSVVERLGAGGMAEVFKCQLSGVGGFVKTVVVKRILPDHLSNPEFLSMFLDEARIAANLTHPNVVQIFEIDEVDGVPHIAMEYVPGLTLHQLLLRSRQGNAFHLGHVLRIFAEACAGLHYAHDACDVDGNRLGLVHRDVSPENIMVSEGGVAKVLDFGVAKAAGRLSVTEVGMLKGKVRYLSPEQLAGEEADHRADVYALGVCLYYAVTGKYPFEADTMGGIIGAKLNGFFPLPSELSPEVPRGLEAIIEWALTMERDDRCPDCQSLQHALEELSKEGPYVSDQRSVAQWVCEFSGHEPNAGDYSLSATTAGSAHDPAVVGSAGSASEPVHKGTSRRLKETGASGQRSGMGTGGATPSPPARHSNPRSEGEGKWGAGKASARNAIQKAEGRSTHGPLFWVVSGIVVLVVIFVSYRALQPEASMEISSAGEEQSGGGSADADQAVAAYLSEVERLAAAERYVAASELLIRARSAGSGDPTLNIRLAELSDRVETAAARERAQSFLDMKDYDAAAVEARKALARAPADGKARALLDRALMGKKEGERAGVGASRARAGGESGETKTSTAGRGERTSMQGGRGETIARVSEGDADGSSDALSKVVQEGTSSASRRSEDSGASPHTSSGPAASPSSADSVVKVVDGEQAGGQDAHRDLSRHLDVAEGGESSEVSGAASGLNSPTAVRQSTSDLKGPAGSSKTMAGGDGLLSALPGQEKVAIEAPRLPVLYHARSMKDLVRVFEVVEGEAVDRGGVARSQVRGVGKPLASALLKSFAPGQVYELHPRAMYYFIVKEVKNGGSVAVVGERLRDAHFSGQLKSTVPAAP